jgi:hypothetical protein
MCVWVWVCGFCGFVARRRRRRRRSFHIITSDDETHVCVDDDTVCVQEAVRTRALGLLVLRARTNHLPKVQGVVASGDRRGGGVEDGSERVRGCIDNQEVTEGR